MLYRSQTLENYDQNINVKDLLKILNTNKNEFKEKYTLVLFSVEYMKYLTSKNESEITDEKSEIKIKVSDHSKSDGYSYDLTFSSVRKIKDEKDMFFYLSDLKTDNPEYNDLCFPSDFIGYDNCCYMLKYNEQNQIKTRIK